MCLGVPGIGSFRNKTENKIVFSYGNAWLKMALFEALGWSRHIVTVHPSPRISTQKYAMPFYPGVHVGHYIPVMFIRVDAAVGIRGGETVCRLT